MRDFDTKKHHLKETHESTRKMNSHGPSVHSSPAIPQTASQLSNALNDIQTALSATDSESWSSRAENLRTLQQISQKISPELHPQLISQLQHLPISDQIGDLRSLITGPATELIISLSSSFCQVSSYQFLIEKWWQSLQKLCTSGVKLMSRQGIACCSLVFTSEFPKLIPLVLQQKHVHPKARITSIICTTIALRLWNSLEFNRCIKDFCENALSDKDSDCRGEGRKLYLALEGRFNIIMELDRSVKKSIRMSRKETEKSWMKGGAMWKTLRLKEGTHIYGLGKKRSEEIVPPKREPLRNRSKEINMMHKKKNDTRKSLGRQSFGYDPHQSVPVKIESTGNSFVYSAKKNLVEKPKKLVHRIEDSHKNIAEQPIKEEEALLVSSDLKKDQTLRGNGNDDAFNSNPPLDFTKEMPNDTFDVVKHSTSPIIFGSATNEKETLLLTPDFHRFKPSFFSNVTEQEEEIGRSLDVDMNSSSSCNRAQEVEELLITPEMNRRLPFGSQVHGNVMNYTESSLINNAEKTGTEIIDTAKPNVIVSSQPKIVEKESSLPRDEERKLLHTPTEQKKASNNYEDERITTDMVTVESFTGLTSSLCDAPVIGFPTQARKELHALAITAQQNMHLTSPGALDNLFFYQPYYSFSKNMLSEDDIMMKMSSDHKNKVEAIKAVFYLLKTGEVKNPSGILICIIDTISTSTESNSQKINESFTDDDKLLLDYLQGLRSLLKTYAFLVDDHLSKVVQFLMRCIENIGFEIKHTALRTLEHIAQMCQNPDDLLLELIPHINNFPSDRVDVYLYGLRVLCKSVPRLSKNALEEALPNVMPGIMASTKSQNVECRKVATFAIVEVYLILNKKLDVWLAQCNEVQRRLVHVYVGKRENV